MQQSNELVSTKVKRLGLFTLTSLVFGNMVGSGIFLLPSSLASIGSISLYSWCITAIGALLLAIVFSKTSVLLPKQGGPYAYTYHAFGEFIGFQTAFYYWTQIWVGNAAISLAAVGYLAVFLPLLGIPINACLMAILLVWLFTLVNIIGIHHAGRVQLVTSIAKFIPLLAIGIGGWWYFQPHFLSDSFNVYSKSDFVALSHAASLTLWGFIGLESATIPSDSVINPERNIPLATLIGTLAAAIVFIATSSVIMGMIPPAVLAKSYSPFAAAAEMIFGAWGKWFIAAGAAVSCFGSLNGWILLQGQITLAAARDKLFPAIFARVNKVGTPAWGLVITSVFTSVLLFFTIKPNLVNQFYMLALLTVLASLVPYFFTVCAEILILKQKEEVVSFSTIMHVIVAVLAGIYSFWAILSVGDKTIFYGTVLLFITFPVYTLIMWYRKRG